ncbi:MAG: phage Enkosi [Actinomycetota bacterium]
MMRALEVEVTDAVWAAIEPMLPPPPTKRRGRPRKPDKDVFLAIVWRLIHGYSWEAAEHAIQYRVSDTTIRHRRDEWIALGVFDRLINQAIFAFDRIIGLDLSHAAIDGSLQKAPCGGEGTGPNPCDRGKRGWKWSIMTERHGIPIGFDIAGANRQDMVMLDATLHDTNRLLLIQDVDVLNLDRGYDNQMVRDVCHAHGLTDVNIALKRKRSKRGRKRPSPRQNVGPRWIVERTNSWLTNFGQLRRNTDRSSRHRRAQLQLACVLIITSKLIDYRNRWSNFR